MSAAVVTALAWPGVSCASGRHKALSCACACRHKQKLESIKIAAAHVLPVMLSVSSGADFRSCTGLAIGIRRGFLLMPFDAVYVHRIGREYFLSPLIRAEGGTHLH